MTAPQTGSPRGSGFFLARILVLLLGLGAFGLVFSYSPGSEAVLECQIKRLTGRECPACGITRGLSALFHGRFRESFSVYPFALPVAAGTLFAMTGALLPAGVWRRMMAVRWFPWLIGLGAGGTGIGIVVRWIWRCF